MKYKSMDLDDLASLAKYSHNPRYQELAVRALKYREWTIRLLVKLEQHGHTLVELMKDCPDISREDL